MARTIWTTGDEVKATDLNNNFYFGGDGSDGDLIISAGVTTIDLAGVAVFTKNYSSISITDTGGLAFINPSANGTVIILRSSGDVTITSTIVGIDASGMGAGAGKNAQQILDTDVHFGVSTDSTTSYTTNLSGRIGGAGGLIISEAFKQLYTASPDSLYSRFIYMTCGSGGIGGLGGMSNVGGDGGGGAGGAGGVGGGALLIECGGAFNFTSEISCVGLSGQNGSAGTIAGAGGGGGGAGGAGGSCIILYNTLISNTGIVSVSSGAGGAGGVGVAGTGSSDGGGGGSGGSGTGGLTSAGGGGGNGADGTISSLGGDGGNGGNAGASNVGISVVGKNEYFT